MASVAPSVSTEQLTAALLEETCRYCEAVLTEADIPHSAAAKTTVLRLHRTDLPPMDIPLLAHLSDEARRTMLQDRRTMAQMVRDRLAYLADLADRQASADQDNRKIFTTLATFLSLAGRWASIAVQTRQLPTPEALAGAADLLVNQARLPGRIAPSQLPL